MICATLVNNVVEATAETTCTDLVLLSPQEFNWVVSLGTLFQLPDYESMLVAFGAGFSTPLVCWLAAMSWNQVMKTLGPN